MMNYSQQRIFNNLYNKKGSEEPLNIVHDLVVTLARDLYKYALNQIVQPQPSLPALHQGRE